MKDIRFDSPLKGTLIPLGEVKDPAFSSEAMGRGAAVKAPEGKVYAPFDGTITVFFDTKHALGLHSDDGIDLLIHVGLDTVNLNGQYFTAHAAQGDTVKKGQLLLEFDAAAIEAAGYDVTTPVLVTNAADYGKITIALADTEMESLPAAAPAAPAGEADESLRRLPKEERVAIQILQHIGGKENISSV